MKKYTLSVPVSIIDYQLSHGQLLFRGQVLNHNIDIIFLGVFYMDVKMNFSSIQITFCSEDKIKEVEQKTGFVLTGPLKVYGLQTEQDVFYVGAGKCLVYKNQLDFNESSIAHINQNRGELLESF